MLSNLLGAFKVFGDTAQLMIPLVIRALINFSKEGESEPEYPLLTCQSMKRIVMEGNPLALAEVLAWHLVCGV